MTNLTKIKLGQKHLVSSVGSFLKNTDPLLLISVTDARGVITYSNGLFERASKYTRNELVGQNHRILKSGHQPDDLFEDLWINISNGKVWRGIIKNRAKDGSYFWVDTLIIPFLGNNNRPEKYMALRTLEKPQ